MNDCEKVESLAARWADGELTDTERAQVRSHLDRCDVCRDDLHAQHAARAAVRAHGPLLAARDAAPPALRERCARAAREPRLARRRRVMAAVAATLVLVAGGWTLHVVTERSTAVLAAQLAADHVKCHAIQGDVGVLEADVVQQHLLARYGFDAKVPPSSPAHRFRLIGARRCLTGEGTNAHVLYEVDNHPVSLYLLPGDSRPPATLDALGRHAVLWSRHNGTYVLVADRDVADLARLSAYVQQATR